MWSNVILIGIFIVCVVTDLKERKIYNVLVLPALLIAWIGHWMVGGWSALGMSLSGFLIGFSILLVPYLFGGMGAGDVKLLALIGALKGTQFVLATAFYMALIGGIMALVVLLSNTSSRKAAYAYLMYIYGLTCGVKIPFHVSKDSVNVSYPYGVAIAGGGILVLLGKRWGIG